VCREDRIVSEIQALGAGLADIVVLLENIQTKVDMELAVDTDKLERMAEQDRACDEAFCRVQQEPEKYDYGEEMVKDRTEEDLSVVIDEDLVRAIYKTLDDNEKTLHRLVDIEYKIRSIEKGLYRIDRRIDSFEIEDTLVLGRKPIA
jgi:hypothetical protein